ncbi:unnamed protein product [Periconia digitata]|uniref:Uncharacterized protein n=1 Tax=Periconia digitata TaxID=1303443 RepID=A0A9W4XMM3_9PLEO|nr:unnamed protein product [Periconia digitata]
MGWSLECNLRRILGFSVRGTGELVLRCSLECRVIMHFPLSFLLYFDKLLISCNCYAVHICCRMLGSMCCYMYVWIFP